MVNWKNIRREVEKYMRSYADDLPNVQEVAPIIQGEATRVIDTVTQRVSEINNETRERSVSETEVLKKRLALVNQNLDSIGDALLDTQAAINLTKKEAKKWKKTLVVLGIIQTLLISATGGLLFYSLGYWTQLKTILGL